MLIYETYAGIEKATCWIKASITDTHFDANLIASLIQRSHYSDICFKHFVPRPGKDAVQQGIALSHYPVECSELVRYRQFLGIQNEEKNIAESRGQASPADK